METLKKVGKATLYFAGAAVVTLIATAAALELVKSVGESNE